jgi:hypothetical protein
MHARYCSSAQGRFTSPDTVLGSIANPQSLNRYAYVGNNPLNFSDPTGHDRFDPSSNGFSEAMTDEGQGGYMTPDNPDFDPESILTQHQREFLARINSIHTTGYDPEWQRFVGDVTIRATDNKGYLVGLAVLSKPTLQQVEAVGNFFTHILDQIYYGERRAAAMTRARNSGLLNRINVGREAGEGWVFSVKPKEEDSLQKFLNGPDFKHSSLVLTHRKEALCDEPDAECVDYRSDPGVFGKGSMQVVYNKTYAVGYFDVDRFSPYHRPPFGFILHNVGEVLL